MYISYIECEPINETSMKYLGMVNKNKDQSDFTRDKFMYNQVHTSEDPLSKKQNLNI